MFLREVTLNKKAFHNELTFGTIGSVRGHPVWEGTGVQRYRAIDRPPSPSSFSPLLPLVNNFVSPKRGGP